MGQAKTNTDCPIYHWNPRAGGGQDLVEWKMTIHHGTESVDATFPVVTGATFWNGLRSAAQQGQTDFEDYIDTDAPSAWKTEWVNEVAGSTEVEADVRDWFIGARPG